MPSRLPPSPPPQAAAPPPLHHRESHLIPPLATATATAFSFLLFLTILYRKLTRKRTTPSDLKPPRHHHRRFSYSTLRRATSSFSPSNRLGQGGFGSVYRGTLKSGQEIAVKLMDSGSLQGEREFQNELNLSGKIESNYCVSLIGFCCERRRRRMLLVYELMHNRSLQDCLFEQKCVKLMEWKTRFKVALDIARGLEFLHSVCEPPIIHGDIKPSNILFLKAPSPIPLVETNEPTAATKQNRQQKPLCSLFSSPSLFLQTHHPDRPLFHLQPYQQSRASSRDYVGSGLS